MIGVAARGAAARVTLVVLLAAVVRNALGDPFGTAVFVGILAALWIRERRRLPDYAWSAAASLFSGLVCGIALVFLVRSAFLQSVLPLNVFYPWAIAAATVAVVEELAIRGVLQPHWTEEVGPLGALLLTATVFSVIHLPRYGLPALPLDFAVGLILGGLRLASGRVLPSAVAHVVADLAAYI